MRYSKIYSLTVFICSFCVLFASCKKYLDIAPPISTLTTAEIFDNNTQAEWAIAGLYSRMINGVEQRSVSGAAQVNFGAGLATLAAGFSADELLPPMGNLSLAPLFENKLTVDGTPFTNSLWTSAYRGIYDANGIIEGIEASKSDQLTDSVRKQLTGEALAMRAFSYFYLVNFFGDVPLVLTTDFNQTVALSRSPVNVVYNQLIEDLKKAKSLLPDNFRAGNNERVRINKWFAEALLARIYLYAGQYNNAVIAASSVIAHNSLFTLETELNNVFLKNSNEAIFQLKSTNENNTLGNATPEGYQLFFTAQPPFSVVPSYVFTTQLAESFEPTDKRKTIWAEKHGTYYSPAKYKVGVRNKVANSPHREYYTVMRLAELYLIRAEANVLLSDANKDLAIGDLNHLRRRADVDELEKTLTAIQVTNAIAHERQVELFAEWGHRWFDLKRTGKAQDVLSSLSYKSPWKGNYQLLYPIPTTEIKYNNNLIQNPLYIR